MQDVNRIVDNINNEWANDMVNIKKKCAILQEENGRLKEEVKKLKKNKSEEKPGQEILDKGEED